MEGGNTCSLFIFLNFRFISIVCIRKSNLFFEHLGTKFKKENFGLLKKCLEFTWTQFYCSLCIHEFSASQYKLFILLLKSCKLKEKLQFYGGINIRKQLVSTFNKTYFYKSIEYVCIRCHPYLHYQDEYYIISS